LVYNVLSNQGTWAVVVLDWIGWGCLLEWV